MNTDSLIDTAAALLADGKGVLAMDESNRTCNQRFADAGIEQTGVMRLAYRELLLTAPSLGTCISGVILYDETIRQTTVGGRSIVQLARDAGLLVGIKVDAGAKAQAGHHGEQVTEGLDGLRERLSAYAAMGARFAKWRAVIAIDTARLPSLACIDANAHALARYAALCQEAGLVPIVEPEVLMRGPHDRARCAEVSAVLLRSLFVQFAIQNVMLEGLILKPNMVTAGSECLQQDSDAEVADATLQCLLRAVPAAVAGIAFLSGGQPGVQASSRLNAMQAAAGGGARATRRPWPLSFSFARALQHPALEIWAGNDANRDAAQAALLHRARCNAAAVRGAYVAGMEAQ